MFTSPPPPENMPHLSESRFCATCQFYTSTDPTHGICQPPEILGGEPFAIAVRADFLACWIYRRKTSSENNRKQ